MKRIEEIEKEMMNKDIPAFNVGDTIRVMVKVPEADKIRIHPFEGLVLKKRGIGTSSTFTMRKISFGEGVERVFPLYSPIIESIEVLRKGKVKRAKIYYVRRKIGKGAKVESERV
ncbi:50S ribosomal protein L19 [Candidatus Omnitrophota bacterium]